MRISLKNNTPSCICGSCEEVRQILFGFDVPRNVVDSYLRKKAPLRGKEIRSRALKLPVYLNHQEIAEWVLCLVKKNAEEIAKKLKPIIKSA